MAKGKKRVNNKQPEKQDLFAISNAGRSHPSNTDHSGVPPKKPNTEKVQIFTKKEKENYL